ncbi:MAG: 5-(carboxyamino)imidazole ribonucleotide synthase [Ignisphaera sp.]
MRFLLQDLTRTTIGILGGGQLGWMMVLECRRYPIKFYVLSNPEEPACRIADRCYSIRDFKEFVDSVDIVTFEFEHVSNEALQYSSDRGKLIPKIDSVLLKRERWREKEFYRKHWIPTPRFFIAQDAEEAIKIVRNEFNYVCVIKQSKGGYDGRGQYFIKSRRDLDIYIDTLMGINDIFVVEEYIDFDYEASIIAVRGSNKEFKAYPPTYNYNRKGILIHNYGPLPEENIRSRMVEIAEKLTKALDYVGVMGIEFFVKNGDVYVNEFSPRVHNTGHYTIDAAFVSQFEQHIRAILGLSLGDTSLLSFGGMVNILGLSDVPADVIRYGKVYWYGKNKVRRRKMGHVNIVGSSLDELEKKIDTIVNLLYPDGIDNYI